MKVPNAGQLEAILATEDHVLVAAGAGSGKTSTVVGRILYLLGVPVAGRTMPRPLELRDIAAITYTNAAAADLKRKLRDELRAAGRRDVAYELDGARIGTIHAFCGAILREFALRSARNPGARVMEEGEARALAAEAIHESLLTALEHNRVPDLAELFARYEVAKVKEWVGALTADSARLQRFADRRAELDVPARALVDFAIIAKAEVERRLHDAGALDFDRMIVLTRDLLRQRESVRRKLRQRVRTLIVDEFQDVDPSQRDIAYALGAPAERLGDSTRLMLVGDPKQSIYRFRRADVTVWREVQRDFAEHGLGRVVRLEENFRSVPAIVGFADASVGALLDRPFDGSHADYEVPYQALSSTREPDPGRPRPVELIVLDGAKDLKADERRGVEAAAVARRMKEIAAEGVPYRDMAMVLTGWGALGIYQKALEGEGIPTYALLAEGFYDRREVWDLVLALETLRDPREDRALLGFLRSPFVGVKDETLLDIVRQTGRPVWNRIGEVKVLEQELLKYGLALIRDHSLLRDRLPIHDLLASLLERSGYLAHLVALGNDGRQPLANVRKFLRIAREFRDGNVGDFLRAVRESRKREDQEADERLFGQHEDVVTITSVHSAKGLEWPVVFWADLAREPRGAGTDPILIGREMLALKDPDEEEQGPEWIALQQQEKAEAKAEAKRLWYVAATRAKDRLILSGFSDKMKAGCAATELGIALKLGGADGVLAYTDRHGQEFEALVRVIPADQPAPAPLAEAFAPADVPATGAPVRVAAGRPRHSATELMSFARCARRHWFKYVAGVREPALERSGPEWGGAIARGQVVHDVLERIREDAELEQLVDAAVGRWDPDSPAPDTEPGREYREALAREVSAVRGHAAYRALDDAAGRRRELEFYHLISSDDFLQGKIDLAAPVDGGIAALDVKTGGGERDALERKAAGYDLQRSVYVGALEAVSASPVTSFAFHFATGGVQIGGLVTDELRRAGAETVSRALEAMGEDAPALTSFPLECRWCGYRKAKWCPGVQETP